MLLNIPQSTGWPRSAEVRLEEPGRQGLCGAWKTAGGGVWGEACACTLGTKIQCNPIGEETKLELLLFS